MEFVYALLVVIALALCILGVLSVCVILRLVFDNIVTNFNDWNYRRKCLLPER